MAKKDVRQIYNLCRTLVTQISSAADIGQKVETELLDA